MIKNLLSCLLLYSVVLFFVFIYTLFIETVAQKFQPTNSAGNLIYDSDSNIRGSLLLAQKINSDKFFKGRDNRPKVNTCNKALYDKELKNILLEKYKESDKHDISFITSSASLLDPYITIKDAYIQAPAVARSNNMSQEHIHSLIQGIFLERSFPFFDLDIVNTTYLNSKLFLLLSKPISFSPYIPN